MTATSPPPPPEHDVLQQEDEIDSRAITAAALTGGVLSAIAVLFAGLVVSAQGPERPARADRVGREPGPPPGALQTPILAAPYGIDMRDRQRRELERWGWVDREHGLASIPIDRAIDVVIAEEAR
jgi:hypothetical protein